MMMTVLIADDYRERIEHILNIVNWEWLGFKIIGHYSTGTEAMEAIYTHWPDLVFASDALPLLSGIELVEQAHIHGLSCNFIIIGDIGNFETAHRAMRLGVEEYLLSPITADEVTRILDKYAERRRAIDGQDLNERFLRTRRLLRNSFMDSLTALSPPEELSVEGLNTRYQFRFQEGIYQAAIIVVSKLPHEEKGIFLAAVVENVRARFDPVCYEMVPYIHNGGSKATFIFNYSNNSDVERKLPELLHIVREHLNKRGCSETIFSIGIGLPENSILKLKQAMDTADRAVRCIVLREPNRIYNYGNLVFDKLTSIDFLTTTLLRELKRNSEAMNIKDLELTLRGAFSPISGRTDPAVIIDICWAAVEAVANACKSETDDLLAQRKEISEHLGEQITVHDIISEFIAWAAQQFSRYKMEREYMRPVRDAMRYIKKNCTQSLTLEQVAEQVHFNPSYFSTVFKKETGQNFSEYLTSCRMEEAKRLFRESNLNVAQICAVIGYADTKHFSRVFTKLIGVKPSEYRTLHR